jgi:hypothetical protein
MKHDTFKNTSYEYKKGQFGSFAKGLLLAYYSGDNKQRQEALRMMKEFNHSGLGVTLGWDSHYKFISINITFTNEIYSISYDKIRNDGDGYNF